MFLGDDCHRRRRCCCWKMWHPPPKILALPGWQSSHFMAWASRLFSTSPLSVTANGDNSQCLEFLTLSTTSPKRMTTILSSIGISSSASSPSFVLRTFHSDMTNLFVIASEWLILNPFHTLPIDKQLSSVRTAEDPATLKTTTFGYSTKFVQQQLTCARIFGKKMLGDWVICLQRISWRIFIRTLGDVWRRCIRLSTENKTSKNSSSSFWWSPPTTVTHLKFHSSSNCFNESALHYALQ